MCFFYKKIKKEKPGENVITVPFRKSESIRKLLMGWGIKAMEREVFSSP